MPICTLHLLALSIPIPQFLHTLKTTNLKPLIISKVIRWIILPTTISVSPLLAHNISWSLLLILPNTTPLPPSLQSLITHQWSVCAGVPSRLLSDFPTKNAQLLHPSLSSVPKLTGSLNKPQMADSAQELELDPELRAWIEKFGEKEGKGAVSMLNLLAFKEGLKGEYLKYGAEFARNVGSKRGGVAKIVGSVIHGDGKGGFGGNGEGGDGWDEVALAHYPSIWHFADMLGSEDYQDVNRKYRVGSLRDTFILCTSELGIEDLWDGIGSGKRTAKL